MNLIGEQFVPNKPDKSGKLKTIILISIVALVVAILIVVILMAVLKEEKITVKLNGENNAQLKNSLIFEEDGTVHIPIKEVASYFGYESYNGNYLNKSEDTSSCYVETNEEAVCFELDSDKIEKVNKKTQEVTYFYINEPVKMIDGKLYTTSEGIAQAYNAIFTYDQKTKKVVISTMQYLVDSYESAILEFGFKEISKEFNDEKAILNNLVIVKDTKGQYGIFNVSTDTNVLEAKYDSIEYIPMSGDFLVESNDKIGIVSSEGKERIKVQYSSIELINQELKLYVVKKDEKIGVIDENESVIIPINCNKIGIDSKTFSKNDIKNKYIILDKIIPVMKDDLWGLYDIEGTQLTDFKYEGFGCTSSSTRNTENVIIVPSYKVIIARKDRKYVLINQYGEELLNGALFDEAYMTVDVDEVKYYLVRNKKTYDAEELLEKLKERTQGSNQTENKQDEEDEEERQNNQNREEEQDEQEEQEEQEQEEQEDEENEEE